MNSLKGMKNVLYLVYYKVLYLDLIRKIQPQQLKLFNCIYQFWDFLTFRLRTSCVHFKFVNIGLSFFL